MFDVENLKIRARTGIYATGQERVVQILETAVDILIHDGFPAVTLREIARRMGIRVSAISHYYSSREDLLLDVLSGVLNSYEAFFGDLREASDQPAEERLRAFIRAMHDSGPIDALICNAGIQETGAVSLTSEGFETTFATNHLGHFLLARGLLGELSSHGCVVFVSSNTHDPTKHTGMPAPAIDDVDDLAHGRAFQDQAVSVAARRRYTTSKLCNVLCAYELDRRLRAVTAPAPSSLRVYAFDPGLMPGTGLARGYGAAARFGWKYVLPVLTLVVPNTNSVCLSGSRLARIADEDAAPASGTYITRGRVAPSSKLSYDDELAKRLWESSARLCGLPADLMSEETRR